MTEQDARPDARPEKQHVSPGGALALVVVAVCAISLLMNLSGAMRRQPGRHAAVGKKVFRYQLEPLLHGDEPLVSSELAGQVTLVNNWGPWCGPCRAEFPELLEVLAKFRDRDDFRFVSVAYPNGETLEQHRALSRQFLDRFKATFPVYYDQDGTFRNSVQFALGDMMVFPTTFVVDREGVIQGVWSGYLPGIGAEMNQVIDEALAAKG